MLKGKLKMENIEKYYTRYKTNFFIIVFLTGSLNDPIDLFGITHVVEHYILLYIHNRLKITVASGGETNFEHLSLFFRVSKNKQIEEILEAIDIAVRSPIDIEIFNISKKEVLAEFGENDNFSSNQRSLFKFLLDDTLIELPRGQKSNVMRIREIDLKNYLRDKIQDCRLFCSLCGTKIEESTMTYPNFLLRRTHEIKELFLFSNEKKVRFFFYVPLSILSKNQGAYILIKELFSDSSKIFGREICIDDVILNDEECLVYLEIEYTDSVNGYIFRNFISEIISNDGLINSKTNIKEEFKVIKKNVLDNRQENLKKNFQYKCYGLSIYDVFSTKYDEIINLTTFEGYKKLLKQIFFEIPVRTVIYGGR